MKSPKYPHQPGSEELAQSAFRRFAKTMRALVAVPKDELEEKLVEYKEKRAASPKAG